MKKIILLTILFLLLSCSQQITLRLNENLSGEVSGRLILKPLFSSYLKDLDMLMNPAAFEATALPGLIEEGLNFFAEQNNYQQEVRFAGGSFEVDYSLSFVNLNQFFNETEGDMALVNRLFTVTTGRVTTLNFNLNRQNLTALRQFLPLPNPQNFSRAGYIDELARVLASPARREAARNEITASSFSLVVVTPRPILTVVGGTPAAANRAVFTISLIDLLYVDTPLNFSLSY
ncbi:MAG: hypothetical protein FWE37_02915 [Spirochaetaceae bacterium]|nr:hypothetical protein [Spirochaetaceae bacterium]